MIAQFSIKDKLGKIQFFEKIFFLADSSMEIVLWISFLALSNPDIQFDIENFTQKSYNTAKALPTTRQIVLINEQKLAKAALNKSFETFVVDVTTLELLEPAIHLFRVLLLAALQQKKVLTKILLEYTNYADIFFHNLVMDLPKNTNIKKLPIELAENKQPPYSPIYSQAEWY